MRLIDADVLRRKFAGGDDYKSISESIHDEIFISAIDAAPTISPYEWISVEDRLPEARTRVLCYFKSEQDYPDVVCENFYYGGGHWLSEGSRATHWMSLPELPTENSK